MSKKKMGLSDKLIWSVIHGIEQFAYSENFNISNKSNYEEILSDGIMSLRYYPALEESEIEIAGERIAVQKDKHRVPVILVPPLAATSMIFDLMPHRSVVRFFQSQGFEVYLVDWGDVTADHKNLSLESYVLEWMPMVIDKVITHSDEDEVSIFAYCMGGLLSLMYLATHDDESVRNLVTVASPVDMHQSGTAGKLLSAIYKPAHAVSNILNFSLLDLPSRYFHVPGWTSSLVFKMTNPMGSVINTYEKFLNLWDRAYLEESLTMSKWFDDMVDYPGRTIREMAVHMAINNKMAKGRMRIGQTTAEFNQIKCSILAFAGEDDNLVSVTAAQRVLDIVSSEDKQFCVVPGGHAGVFAGGKAPQNAWRISTEWLAKRSA